MRAQSKNWPKRVWYKLTSLILLQLLLLKMTFPTLMSAQIKSLTLVVRTPGVWTIMETTLAHVHRDLHRQRSERPEERISNVRVGCLSHPRVNYHLASMWVGRVWSLANFAILLTAHLVLRQTRTPNSCKALCENSIIKSNIAARRKFKSEIRGKGFYVFCTNIY